MREMVEGRDGEGEGEGEGEGRRMVERRDGKERRMAERGDDDGEGQRMAEGRDAMARRDCGHDEGDAFCTLESRSEPPVAVGNNSIQDDSFCGSQDQSEPSSAIGNRSILGVAVYTRQGQSQPHFGMSSNYVQGHGHGLYISQSRPVSQNQPPFAMGRKSVHHVMYPTYDGNNTPQSMPLVYPTQTSFQELLRDTSVQHFAVQMLQASHSLADNHVDGHP
ncbi:hypothetical protein CsSME_00026451 [Camellia sinensis var. sinensis]